ncbi:MAG: type II toxin-antitoxin system prevent-host-death family antitoxin [Gammaproteobacteria bacterium]|nr:type II toxin-antitoxin system prevent-host-death family antitoxin [Gammaproteobacteria bacterium]
MLEISIREINQNFSRYMQAVESGEEIVITRRGKPAARLVAIAESRNLTKEQQAARLRTQERMRQGCQLGGRPVTREEIYERRTDYS